MPLSVVRVVSPHQVVGVWRMAEEADDLQRQYARFPWYVQERGAPLLFGSPRRQREFYAQHLLLYALAQRMGCRFVGIWKNTAGKPFPYGASYHLSVAHTAQYLMASIHLTRRVGVDIEHMHRSFDAVQTKFLNEQEITICTHDARAYSTYWAAKEACYKWLGDPGCSMRHALHVHQPPPAWRVEVLSSPRIWLSLRRFVIDNHVAVYSV